MSYKEVLRTVGLISLLWILNNYLWTQEPLWHWALSAGGEGSDISNGIALDSSGNIHIVGYFRGNAMFGDTEMQAAGNPDIFVAKINPEGEWLRVISAGGTGNDRAIGVDIALDNEGNSYITGHFSDSLYFGNLELTGDGGTDSFIAKMNVHGDWVWAVSIGGGGRYVGSTAIDIDNNGNIYIVGEYNNIAVFGEIELECLGHFDVFVAKLSRDGEWAWAISGNGYNEVFSNDIVVDNQGNSYITGQFQDIAHFGNYGFQSEGNYDLFTAKISPEGEWLWVIQAGGEESCVGRGITLDTEGNSYITGYFYGRALFGETQIRSSGDYDIFAAKINRRGEWSWVVRGGGTGGCSGRSITVDNDGYCYVTGYIQGRASFGVQTLQSSGSYDAFIGKLNSQGQWLWARNGGGIGSDSSYGIAVDDNRNRYITGFISYTAAFGETELVSNGNLDIFVAKIGEYYPFPDIAGNPFPEDDSAGISISPGNLQWDYVVNNHYTNPHGFKVYFHTKPEFNNHNYVYVPYILNRVRYSCASVLPQKLEYGTTYYWKIVPTTNTVMQYRDSGEVNVFLPNTELSHVQSRMFGNDALNCPIWSFTTIKDYPVPSQEPVPTDESIGVSVNLNELRWRYIEDYRHLNPQGFRVYFGENETFADDAEYEWIEYLDGQTDYSCSDILPLKLSNNKTYYWQVVPTTEPERGSGRMRRSQAERGNEFFIERDKVFFIERDKVFLIEHGNEFLIERGDALNCPVWSFRTEEATSIDSPPFPVTELGKNYPNPFNPETVIGFSLAQESNVRMIVYNIKGETVRTLLNRTMEAGRHSLIWDGTDDDERSVSSGVYFYRMIANDYQSIKVMLLVK